jgi:hypothetical protein
MFLSRILYASTATDQFKPKDIEDILNKARQENSKLDITGMLCFSSNFFMQCIEASRANVNKLYHKVLNDKRHSNIILLNYQEISERDFGNWSMSYIPDTSLTTSINLKFSENSIFDPYQMSGESAHKMMLELRDVLHSAS